MSSLIVESMRATYVRQTTFAVIVQKCGRGFYARRDTAVIKRCAYLTDKERELYLKRKAACMCIQRATRCFQAKEKATLRRRKKIAVLIIQKYYRMHLAIVELHRLQAARDVKLWNIAAARIQRCTKQFLKTLELRRLDAYYKERKRLELQQMRRMEAATTCQAVWRGYATRKATAAERNRLLQKTMDCIRIQRTWRAHRFRIKLNGNMTKNICHAKQRRESAIKIQSFWRRILATEYTALIRERRFATTVCVICIQCAWRSFQARKELAKRKLIRAASQKEKASLHDIWVQSLAVVSASLRCIQSGKFVVAHKLKVLRSAVAEKERQKFISQYRAATKIQACYRGHYERCYARGLRKEKEQRDKIARVLKQKQTKAAIRIQCAVRSAWARHEANKRRTALRVKFLEQQADQELKADPHDLVRRMFWSHEALIKKDLTRDRIDRHEQMRVAATFIQRNARTFIAVKTLRRRLAKRDADNAAAALQAKQREAEEERNQIRRVKEVAAAVIIQALTRGVLTRKHWRSKRTILGKQRQSLVREEDLRDAAVIKIQTAWRRHCAKTRCNKIRMQRVAQKKEQERYEAAKLIQTLYRNYACRKSYLERKRAREAKVATPTDVALAPRRPSEDAPPRPPPRKFSNAPSV